MWFLQNNCETRRCLLILIPAVQAFLLLGEIETAIQSDLFLGYNPKNGQNSGFMTSMKFDLMQCFIVWIIKVYVIEQWAYEWNEAQSDTVFYNMKRKNG